MNAVHKDNMVGANFDEILNFLRSWITEEETAAEIKRVCRQIPRDLATAIAYSAV